MLKTNRFWIILFGIVLLTCVALIYISKNVQHKAIIANIYSDNRLIESFDLSSIPHKEIVEIKKDDRVNIIEVDYGRIRMLSANCDNKACVRQITISNGLFPIVCLPNNVVIVIENNQNPDDIDGIVR